MTHTKDLDMNQGHLPSLGQGLDGFIGHKLHPQLVTTLCILILRPFGL